ncbi:transcriptional regulator [Sphingobacterium sp. SYP-B4668]|uniref:transcriptional regulator n=1 Tax=Sphingobacterium sp. SYP-B4668 TaxID=2996035 RepID=UPI0022DDC176|nr:transcriptional regulator [Sphingobacterium sp. SYP-B4668]
MKRLVHKYCLLLAIIVTALNNLQGQSIICKPASSILVAHFEQVRDAVPEMAELYREGEFRITSLGSNDSIATFQIEEKGRDHSFLAEDEKEFNKFLSSTNKTSLIPSIYMLTSYTLKKKNMKPPPPKKQFFFSEYAIIWNLRATKMNDKRTELLLTYVSLAPNFVTKIEQEFKSDIYYNNIIRKIVVNEKKMHKVITDLLVDELHVDQEPRPPVAPTRL